MLKILLVTPEKANFSYLASFLANHDTIDLSWGASGKEAFEIIEKTPPDLVISDEDLKDMTGLELVKKSLFINFMINFAMITTLSAEDFHTASEGLGILASLPSHPGADDAKELLKRLMEIKSLSSESGLNIQ